MRALIFLNYGIRYTDDLSFFSEKTMILEYILHRRLPDGRLLETREA